jgi:hypothetical protein
MSKRKIDPLDMIREMAEKKFGGTRAISAISAEENNGEPWPEPIPLGTDDDPVPFPVGLLPDWQARWVEAKAVETQTPPDLAAMLVLAVTGAALAKKFRVQIRDGWTEPTNIYSVVCLPPGERKSAVFSAALAPVFAFEQEECDRLGPIIAEKESARRVLEARLKDAEKAAAKEEDAVAGAQLQTRAEELACELEAFEVPPEPCLVVDDETPENLAKELARQDGRLLQASAEGAPFEIFKGRYSEKGAPNIEVFLKGHAGDDLRVGRISRDRVICREPALSLALAVQPDVVRGLAEKASLMARGFLARILYSLPRSAVGSRRVAAPPVPPAVADEYARNSLTLWRIKGDKEPLPLRFSDEANDALQEFERWLEPQLAEGETLRHLAGWAQKAAGACARIAAGLHVAGAIPEGRTLPLYIEGGTVEAAIRLVKEYLLPHALLAFALLGADPRVDGAKRVLCHLARNSDVQEFTRAQVYGPLRATFGKPEDLDEPLKLLVGHCYLRMSTSERPAGKTGPNTSRYQVNPLWKRQS